MDKQIVLVKLCCWNINDDAAVATALAARGGDDTGEPLLLSEASRRQFAD